MTETELTEQTIAAFAAWRKNPSLDVQVCVEGKWETPSEFPAWSRWFDYRIKPFELGREVNGHTLGEGEQWHRLDGWTPEMLPAPYRPLIVGEEGPDYEIWRLAYNEWCKEPHGHIPAHPSQPHQRTTRPLPSAQLAPGWNEFNKLTVAQVGKGFRLLDLSEGTDKKHSKEWWQSVEFWYPLREAWEKPNGGDGTIWRKDTLRTRLTREELAALDAPPAAKKPASRPWNCAEDVPMPICWLQNLSGYKCMVVGLEQSGPVCKCLNSSATAPFLWANLISWKYSTDGKMWHPCTVPV